MTASPKTPLLWCISVLSWNSWQALASPTDVGDPARMFNTFVWYVNNICGGVHGRMIDLRLVEVSALGGAGGSIDELRNAACIQATEDHQGV